MNKEMILGIWEWVRENPGTLGTTIGVVYMFASPGVRKMWGCLREILVALKTSEGDLGKLICKNKELINAIIFAMRDSEDNVRGPREKKKRLMKFFTQWLIALTGRRGPVKLLVGTIVKICLSILVNRFVRSDKEGELDLFSKSEVVARIED